MRPNETTCPTVQRVGLEAYVHVCAHGRLPLIRIKTGLASLATENEREAGKH